MARKSRKLRMRSTKLATKNGYTRIYMKGKKKYTFSGFNSRGKSVYKPYSGKTKTHVDYRNG